jgi:hypothetical protein
LRIFKTILWRNRPRLRWTARAIFAGLAGLVLAYPWLTDALARGYLQRHGLSVGASHAGYGGWRWSGVTWLGEGLRVEVEGVEAASPVRWLGLGKDRETPVLLLSSVRVELADRAAPEEAPEPARPADLLAQAAQVVRLLERWLPTVAVDGLELRLATGALQLETLSWRDGRIVAKDLVWEDGGTAAWAKALPTVARVTGERLGADRWRVELTDDRGRRLWLLSGPTKPGEPLAAVFEARWSDGFLSGALEWGTGWIPATATLATELRALPPEAGLDLASWQPEVRGTATWEGEGRRLSVSLGGSGQVEVGGEPVPWTLAVEAAGDPEAVTVEALTVDLPGLAVAMDAVLRLDLETLQPTEAVRLRWAVDRSVWAWLEGEGTAEGSLVLRPHADLEGSTFHLSGVGRGWTLPVTAEVETAETGTPLGPFAFEAGGELTADRVVVESLELSLEGSGRLTAAAVWDRASGLLAPWKVGGRVGEAGLTRWLPEAVTLGGEGVSFDAEGEQTASGWEHRGHLAVPELVLSGSWPAAVEVRWEGRDENLDHWALILRREGVEVSAGGSLRRQIDHWQLAVATLEEVRREGPAWALQAPFHLDWHEATDDDAAAAVLSPLFLARDGGGELRLEGRWAGWADTRLKLEVEQLSRADAAPWLEAAILPELSAALARLELETVPRAGGDYSWVGRADFDATWVSARGRSWIGRGGWTLEERRLAFDDLRLETAETTWLRLRGEVPVGLRGGETAIAALLVDETAPLSWLAEMDPVERLPQPLEERLPFRARALQGRVEASGTLREPKASLELGAEVLEWLGDEATKPIELREILLRATIGDDAINLEQLSLRLAETPRVNSLSGSVGGIDWATWLEDPRLERWLDLSASLQIEAWPLAALGRLLPPQLDPAGTVSVRLEKSPGRWPEGRLELAGLQSRPLAEGLVAREISGGARLDGRRLEDLALTGTIGGRPWKLEGWVDGTRLEHPLFHVALDAERLDLVRRSDLVLRAKAQLVATRTEPETVPRLSGEIRMLRSLWLQSLDDFTRQGAAGVARRPPYFAIESAFLGDWELDVRLTGDDFLQIRTAVLTGEASADLHLGGVFGAPLLTGDVWLERGAIAFPFARLPASELRGRITVEDPHTLRLAGAGEGVAYGYVVQYQLSGTSDEPALTFSSIPSLAQEDILLMVATGAVPSTEVGANATERAGRLALFLGRDFFSELLGQDGASRLEIRMGEGFSPFRRDGQVIEYQLDERWSILGEYDDFGGYNVDLKRRLLQ